MYLQMGWLALNYLDMFFGSAEEKQLSHFMHISPVTETAKFFHRWDQRFQEEGRGIVRVFLLLQNGGELLSRIGQSDMMFGDPFLVLEDFFALIEVTFTEPSQIVRLFGLEIEAKDKIGKQGKHKNCQSKSQYCRET